MAASSSIEKSQMLLLILDKGHRGELQYTRPAGEIKWLNML